MTTPRWKKMIISMSYQLKLFRRDIQWTLIASNSIPEQAGYGGGIDVFRYSQIALTCFSPLKLSAYYIFCYV
jgi:hypothetical protein